METIDLTPSPEAYRHMLQTIIDNSTDKKDVQWAKCELFKMRNVKEWSK